MINIQDKSKCCGCNACAQSCPKGCIKMEEDNEGFLYPVVDHITCVNCGLCDAVCPMNATTEAKSPIAVIAAQNKNQTQLLQSSSGGIFVLLAEQVIREGGKVFGAKFNDRWEVEHCYVETLEELKPLLRSKYVQSNIGGTFKEAEKFLKQNLIVLYAGTPCQIAGLKKYLRKDYPNLITIDFICHGVPSPGVWRKYISKYLPDISSINFRAKQNEGYGWQKYGFVINGKAYGKEEEKQMESRRNIESPFSKGFLRNLYLRPVCLDCMHKGLYSSGDITLADFWHYQAKNVLFENDKGISLIMQNNEKSLELWHKIESKVIYETSSIEVAMALNPGFKLHQTAHSKRNQFFLKYATTDNISELIESVLHRSIAIKFIDKIKKVINK